MGEKFNRLESDALKAAIDWQSKQDIGSNRGSRPPIRQSVESDPVRVIPAIALEEQKEELAGATDRHADILSAFQASPEYGNFLKAKG